MADAKALAIQELARRELARRQGGQRQVPSAVPVPEGADASSFFKPTEQETDQKSSYQLPYPTQTISRETGRAGLPLAGAMLGAATGGPGLLLPSLAAGIGAGGGEIVKQKMEGSEVDLEDVMNEALPATMGTLAGGLVFKGLSKAAEKIFRPSPLDKATERAAKYAQDNDLPFPLRQGGGGLLRQGANVSLLPGRIKTQSDARKVTEFINKMALDDIPKLAPNAKPVGQVVEKGKSFFRNIYNPAKEAGQEGFDKFVTAVGASTKLQVNNLMSGIDDAIDALVKRGLATKVVKNAGDKKLMPLSELRKSTSVAKAQTIQRGAIEKAGFVERADNPGFFSHPDISNKMALNIDEAYSTARNILTGEPSPIFGMINSPQVNVTLKSTSKEARDFVKYLDGLKKSGVAERDLETVEVIRKQISKLAGKSSTKPVADHLKEMILRDYDELGSQIGVSARELASDAIQKSAKFFALKREFPELEFFSKEIADDKWINLLFQGRNAKALSKIRQDSPELYKELSDTWLTTIIQKNTRATDGVVGKVLDGPALRKWYEQNAKDLRAVLGKQKAQVLDNFSRYASHTSEFAAKAKKDEMGAFELGARLAAEGAAIFNQPHIMIPGEATAYVLAKGLSDPSSKLFKLFTSGPSKGFKQTARGSLILGGQSVDFDGSESP